MEIRRIQLKSFYPGANQFTDEILLLGLCALLYTVITVFGLDLSPGLSITTMDGHRWVLPHYMRLAETGGWDWNVLYDPRVIGGVRAHAGHITPWYIQVFLALGGSPATALMTVLLLPHFFCAYLSLRAAELLGAQFSRLTLDPRSWQTWIRRGLCFIIALAVPIFIGQIRAGHVILQVYALLPAILTLTLLVATRSTNRLLYLITLVTIFSAGFTLSYQILLIFLVFSLPLAIAVGVYLKDWRAYFAGIVLGIAVFILAAPFQLDALAHFLGTDAARSMSSESVYSIEPIMPFRVFLNTLPWAMFNYWGFEHEFGVGMGPILLLALLTAFRHSRLLLSGLLGCILLAAIYTWHIPVLSDALVWLVPPLDQFRVAFRAFYPVLLIAIPLALVTLLQRQTIELEPKRISAFALLGLVVILPFILIPLLPHPWMRESVLWLSLLTWAVLLILKPKTKYPLQTTCIAITAACALTSFQARSPRPFALDQAIAKLRQDASVIQQQSPQFRDPLYRVGIEPWHEKFKHSTLVLMGLSAIEGYYMPSQRFARLNAAVRGYEYHSMAMMFATRTDYKGFPVIASLYNLQTIWERKDGQLLAREFYKGPPAWFPHSVQLVDSYLELASELHAISANPEQIHTERAFVIKTDPKITAELTASLDGMQCQSRRILRHSIVEPYFALALNVERGFPCLLTIATNYAENLHAYDLISGEKMPVLPSYGALTGILVPADTEHVLLKAELPPIQWQWVTQLLGLLLLIAGSLLTRRVYLQPPRASRGS